MCTTSAWMGRKRDVDDREESMRGGTFWLRYRFAERAVVIFASNRI